MAIQVLVWKFDHVGDCNRYGNCVAHPYFERPTIEEIAGYPHRIPNGATALHYVPHDAVTANGWPETEAGSAFDALWQSTSVLIAAAGEALHRIQRDHVHEVVQILDSAITDLDRVWNFSGSDRTRTTIEPREVRKQDHK